MAKNRKTKVDKKIADLRRQLHTTVADSPSPQSAPSYTFKATTTQTASVKHEPSMMSKFIASDLRKTFIFSIIAISIQIILYIVLAR